MKERRKEIKKERRKEGKNEQTEERKNERAPPLGKYIRNYIMELGAAVETGSSATTRPHPGEDNGLPRSDLYWQFTRPGLASYRQPHLAPPRL